MSGGIAHVGPDLPLPLLRATGRHAGALRFDPDAPTPTAEQWIESKFAPWAKSILQAWAEGAYDNLDQVLFSRADDNAQRLYYYMCELQRRGLVGGPEPLIFDVAKIPRESSRGRTEQALRQLAARLGIGAETLEPALLTLSELPPATPTSDRRVLLTGTPPPDRRLHDAIERAGVSAVGPTLVETWESPAVPITTSEADPFVRLARQLHSAADGPRSFEDPGAALRQSVARTRASAVILWQIEEDEAQAWHLPAQRRALADANLPFLVMTRRDWLARDGAPGEILDFLRGLVG